MLALLLASEEIDGLPKDIPSGGDVGADVRCTLALWPASASGHSTMDVEGDMIGDETERSGEALEPPMIAELGSSFSPTGRKTPVCWVDAATAAAVTTVAAISAGPGAGAR